MRVKDIVKTLESNLYFGLIPPQVFGGGVKLGGRRCGVVAAVAVVANIQITPDARAGL